MKIYTKLQLPKDSAWDRKTWRRYVHWRIKYFLDGVYNILRWIPTLYHDRDWDDSFILKMLQKKIEYQRKHLVDSNRHVRIDEDNFWMTVALNLLEREMDNHYGTEQYDYMDVDIKFISSKDREGSYEMKKVVHRCNLEDYLTKYKGAVRRVLKANKHIEFTDREKLAFYVSDYNQERARKLLFTILDKYSNRWWD